MVFRKHLNFDWSHSSFWCQCSGFGSPQQYFWASLNSTLTWSATQRFLTPKLLQTLTFQVYSILPQIFRQRYFQADKSHAEPWYELVARSKEAIRLATLKFAFPAQISDLLPHLMPSLKKIDPTLLFHEPVPVPPAPPCLSKDTSSLQVP